MKIKSMTAKGFRGFNVERSINFHDRLTLIYAPNSYGKTSISEALEWLLYGVTSKVEGADYSKDEYKGSYRNSHFPESLTPFVEIILADGVNETIFRAELYADTIQKKYVNGAEVQEWSLDYNPLEIPKPFILQHALKHLLLVTPDERFKGFARLLGFEDLDQIQRKLVSLCTKPDAAIPSEARQLEKDIDALQARLDAQPSLGSVSKNFKRRKKGLSETYETTMNECRQRVPAGTDDASIVPQLLKIRDEAVSKFFKGNIVLNDYGVTEKQNLMDDENFALGYVTDSLIKKYSDLIALATIQYVVNRIKLFDLGINLLENDPNKCPLCGQEVNQTRMQHIRNEHSNLVQEKERNATLTRQRDDVLKSLMELENRLTGYHHRHATKAESFLKIRDSLVLLRKILTPKHDKHYQAIETALSEVSEVKDRFEKTYALLTKDLDDVKKSINESKEKQKLIKALGSSTPRYIRDAKSFVEVVSRNATSVSEAKQVLKYELDSIAGTEDISVLVDLLTRWNAVKKQFEIDNVLDNLKELRRIVDQYVANKMLSAVSEELTSEVMAWYEQIKTKGDPDVHFGGFDLERNSKGELKARRVQIKATSYGKELVSAVSSLSESKLNALGLAISIAHNLKGNSPFEFIVIDDPIQSLDEEHAVQFIDVVRQLVERDKQVILLSHSRQWINQLRAGCRTLNGWFYEITSYTRDGPHIVEVHWEKRTERLKEVDAVLKDPNAVSIRVQQAEEEIRIVIAELASELYEQKTGTRKSPHDINQSKARKMLIECGIDNQLVDKVTQTFETTDDAHHASTGYTASRERLRNYYDLTLRLTQYIK